MKAIIEKESGFCVFYISDDANITFNPQLVVTGNTTICGNFVAGFLTESSAEIISGLPDFEPGVIWRPGIFKVENGAWVDYSAQIKQEIYDREAPRARAAVAKYLTDSIEAQKNSTASSADWDAYRQALSAIESQPDFPFTIVWPEKP